MFEKIAQNSFYSELEKIADQASFNGRIKDMASKINIFKNNPTNKVITPANKVAESISADRSMHNQSIKNVVSKARAIDNEIKVKAIVVKKPKPMIGKKGKYLIGAAALSALFGGIGGAYAGSKTNSEYGSMNGY